MSADSPHVLWFEKVGRGDVAKVGLCGQAPSDHPEFAEFLVDCRINSMSVSPDSFIAVKQRVAARETATPRPRARMMPAA